MRIFHIFLRNYKSCLFDGSWPNVRTNSYSNCLLGTPLKYFNFNFVRSFLIYHSFKNKLGAPNIEHDEGGEENEVKKAVLKKKIIPKVSVINEKNREIVMDLVAAEKYAKRKKMHLVPVEGSRKDRMKYKLENNVSDIIQDNKSKQKELKRIMFREGIAAHDLETKVNQMLKLINKGLKVVGFVEGSIGSEKMNNILSMLEKSKLNEFFVGKTKRARGVQLVYQRKVSKVEEKTE